MMPQQQRAGWQDEAAQRVVEVLTPSNSPELFNHLCIIKPELFVTLRFNTRRPMERADVEARIHRFAARVERFLLGPRWTQKAARSAYWGFIEGGYESHVHLLWRLPKNHEAVAWDVGRALGFLFTDMLRKGRRRAIARAGDVVVYDLRHSENEAQRARAISYAMKKYNPRQGAIIGPLRMEKKPVAASSGAKV
jgi:hypothetical protein